MFSLTIVYVYTVTASQCTIPTADADSATTFRILPANLRKATQSDAPASTVPNTDASALSRKPDFPPAAPINNPLVEAIEAERVELLRAHSLLKCLYEALLNADHAGAISHADTANVAAQLIDDSVARLDIVRLGPMGEKLTLGFSGKNEVKEGGLPAYLS